MDRRRIVLALVAVALVGSLVPLEAASAAAARKIERGLVERLDRGALETFIVEFSGDADLSAAAAARAWDARGRTVYRALTAAAARSQGRARDLVAATRGASAHTYWVTNVMAVRGSSALARRLAALPEVTAVRAPRVEPLVEPVEAHAVVLAAAEPPPWGISKIGADQVWGEGVLGSGIVVANVDTGVDYAHEAIVDQYRGNLGGGTFDHAYNWWDPTDICGDTPCDNAGHGTHTMGTMVGGDGPGPFTPDIGVAPGATWIAAKGCEEYFCTETSLLSAGEFILAPTDLDGLNPDPSLRPDIVNNSWGGGPGDAWYLDLVTAWRAAGIVPVFSSGNPGTECGAGGSPGDYLESFSAGATDEGDLIAEFSGRGPSAFGKINPDIAAPGVDVISSVPGDDYASFSGTSMAAPHTAGTIALIMSAEPALIGDVTSATDAVRSTAFDIADDSCGGDDDGDPNNVYGDGRIDAAAAVSLVATGGTLAGDVTDADTTDPIAGARIEASAGGRTFAATSDAAGHFDLFLAAGTYTVTVTAFGYEAGLATGVEVQTDLTTVQDFSLVPLPRRDITGTVTAEEDGSPMKGAEVRALGTPVDPVRTAADGSYTLTLPIGDFTIRTSAGGCTAAEETEVTLGLDGLVHDVALTRTLDDFGHGCSAIDLDWVDAASNTALFGDQTVGRLPLPFAFPFYGDTYSAVYITDNGYLTFEAPPYGWPDPIPSAIPSVQDPNAAIYGLWQNLKIDDESAIRYETVGATPDRAFVVEYEQVGIGPRFSGDDAAHAGTNAARIDLEIKLWENGAIDILYGDNPANPGDGRNAGIGIENADGTDALSFSLFDDLVSPNSAFRYEVVPNGHAAGIITDANDGSLVQGATVTASPGGRSVTTDEDGSYRLRLRPGTYTLAFTAAAYVAQEVPDVVITDGDDTIVDIVLEAPVAEVDPTALDAAMSFGSVRHRTLTIANTGTSDMTWQVLERDGSRTVPDLPPVPKVVRQPTWAPPRLPGGITAVRPAALPPEALETVIDDPDDDSLGSIEITRLRGGSDNAEMSVALDFSSDTPMRDVTGFLYLDTDQNRKTGYPPRYLFGLREQDIGFDFFVDLFEVGATDPIVRLWDLEFELVAEIPAIVEGHTVSFAVPLTAFGPDEEGDIDIAGVIGDQQEPLDWLPDEGHGSIRTFTDAPWMSAEPASGVLAIGESVEVDVALGDSHLPPGSFEGSLFVLADAPKQRATQVTVAVSVRRPFAWGIASGRVRDAHSGAPLAGTDVVLTSAWEGNPLRIRATTDERGRWAIQGPKGTWEAHARKDGYVTGHHDVRIVAGSTLDGQGFRLHTDQAHATISTRPWRLMLLRGQTAHRTLTLGNIEGHRALTFSTAEIDLPQDPRGGGGGGGGGEEPPGGVTLPAGADADALTSESTGQSSSGIGIDRAGEVLKKWDTGMSVPWGVAYRTPGVVTLSDAEEVFDAEFTTNGRRTGEFDTPWADAWAADMAWDPERDLLWQVNVGGDNGIYGIDPADGAVIDVITGAGWGDISQRGLAYDPATDTFYIGGWNEGIVYHVAGPSWPDPGATLGECQPDESNISGLAWNPAFRVLWMSTNSRSDDIFLIDPETCEIQGGLPHPGRGRYNGAGLELDAAGNLWTVSQGSSVAYLIESGLPTFSDVSWLRVTPGKGVLAPGEERSISIQVDATDLKAGTHDALVAVVTDDPDAGVQTIPIHLLVTKYEAFVDVGGDGSTFPDGTRYVGDRAFHRGSFGWTGTSERVRTAHPVAEASHQGVYRDARVGAFDYRFTAPDGRYRVTLEFAELQQVGEFGRIMDITAEGDLVVNNLDLAGTVGRFRAYDVTFDVRSRGGVLNLGFLRALGRDPILNGIRVTWIPPGA